MDDIISRLRTAIEEQRPAAEKLLETVVNINSHTANKEGVDTVGRVFREHLEPLGFTTKVIPRENNGDILILANEAFTTAGKGGFLFLSHNDTVFPKDGPILPFRIGDGGYHGNGCTDDKGGTVITWQILSALKSAGFLDRIPVQIFLNTDEETGSHNSRAIVEEIGANADMAFVMEYGRPRPGGATVVTSRLGRGQVLVNLNGEKAESTMLEIIEQSYYLATPEDRRLIRIWDFTKEHNTCSARISFNYPNDDEGDYLLMVIKRLVQQLMEMNDVKGTVSGEKVRPPLIFKKNNWDAYDHLKSIARRIDFNIFPEHRTACSDGSFVPVDIPVLDGVGPIGDYVHTEEEFMTKESLTVRPLLLATLMAEMTY